MAYSSYNRGFNLDKYLPPYTPVKTGSGSNKSSTASDEESTQSTVKPSTSPLSNSHAPSGFGHHEYRPTLMQDYLDYQVVFPHENGSTIASSAPMENGSESEDEEIIFKRTKNPNVPQSSPSGAGHFKHLEINAATVLTDSIKKLQTRSGSVARRSGIPRRLPSNAPAKRANASIQTSASNRTIDITPASSQSQYSNAIDGSGDHEHEHEENNEILELEEPTNMAAEIGIGSDGEVVHAFNEVDPAAAPARQKQEEGTIKSPRYLLNSLADRMSQPEKMHFTLFGGLFIIFAFLTGLVYFNLNNKIYELNQQQKVLIENNNFVFELMFGLEKRLNQTIARASAAADDYCFEKYEKIINIPHILKKDDETPRTEIGKGDIIGTDIAAIQNAVEFWKEFGQLLGSGKFCESFEDKCGFKSPSFNVFRWIGSWFW